MDLNENQKLRILTTFEHIDNLFGDIEKILKTPHPSCLYRPYIFDVSPETQHELELGISEFRALMSEVLGSLNIPHRPPHISALHAALTSLIFVDIALEELKSKYTRGYGKLTQESADELDALVLKMKRVIGRISSQLSGYPGTGNKNKCGRVIMIDDSMKNCVFCAIVEGKASCYKICEDNLSFAILDVSPFSKGHCLVLPKRHVPWWHELTETENSSLFKMAQNVAERMMRVLQPDFVCMYARGRRIPHTHVFLIPTYSGDVLDKFFNALEVFQESPPALTALRDGSAMAEIAEKLKLAHSLSER